MEHSLQTYLERQSAGKLHAFLQDILSGAMTEDYTYAIPLITQILATRSQADSTDKTNL